MAKAGKQITAIVKEKVVQERVEEVTIHVELTEKEAGFLLCLFGGHGGRLEAFARRSVLLEVPGHRLPVALQESIKNYSVGDTNAIYYALASVLETKKGE